MPVIYRNSGFNFYFYSAEHEPIHIHVVGKGAEAKIVLEPAVSLIYAKGFTKNDTRKILQLCSEYKDLFIEEWRQYFEGQD